MSAQWSQKSDQDTAKSMSDKPAGGAVQKCPEPRAIEAVFIPPESVDLKPAHIVPTEPEVSSEHKAEPDPAVETSHTTSES